MSTTISGSDAFADADKVIAQQRAAALNSMSIEKAEALGTKRVNEILQLGNLDKKDEKTGETKEEAKAIKNTLTATSDLVSIYGIRQEIITKSDKESSIVVARRKLNDNCKPKEEITVECLGDSMYKVGYGVHVILPFLPTYNDCFMYIKEVNNEWKDNGTFISTLTLTPSRIMDTQEWTDDEEDSTTSSSGTTANSDLSNKILALLRQQIGKPYEGGATGPDKFDCSGLVYYCFNQFKDQLLNAKAVSRTTEEMKNDGVEVDKNDTSKWQPCDLLLYQGSGAYPPPGHVVVYTGNGKVIESPSSGKTVFEHDNTRPSSALMYVRRVIPEITTTSSSSGSTGDSSIPDDYASGLTSVESNCSTFINNMSKYGFKDAIISVSKNGSVDPYVTAGIIAIESEGNPYCGGTYYGLMQVQGGVSDCTGNIKQGVAEFNQKKSVVGDQTHVILSAYNSGEGTVQGAAKASGLTLSSCSIKELGDALYSYVKANDPGWDANEKKYYASKVLKAASILKSKNVLG